MKATTAALILGLLIAGGDANELIKKDKEKLQGRWQVTAAEAKGEKVPAEEVAELEVIFAGDTIQVKEAGKVQEKFSFKIDPSQKPKTIDMTFTDGPKKGRTDRGIYGFEGEQLKICIQENKDAARPKEFATKGGTDLSLVVLKRIK